MMDPQDAPTRDLVLEVKHEVAEFLNTLASVDLPAPDLDGILERLVGSFDYPRDPQADMRSIRLAAADVAYNNDLLHEPVGRNPYVLDGINPRQKDVIVRAVIRFGLRLRDRIMDLGLTDSEGRFFTYCFKGISRDRILTLTPGVRHLGHPDPAPWSR